MLNLRREEPNYVPRYEGEYELHTFLNLALTDYTHDQTALTLGKELLAPTGYDAGWAPVWL